MRRVSEILAQAFAVYKLMPGMGTFAKSAAGEYVEPTNEDVCQVCSLGAVCRVEGLESGKLWRSEAALLLDETAREFALERGLFGVTAFGSKAVLGTAGINDKFPELVEEMFTRAIAKAKQQEAETSSCPVVAA